MFKYHPLRTLNYNWCCWLEKRLKAIYHPENDWIVRWIQKEDRYRMIKLALFQIVDSLIILITFGQLEGELHQHYVFHHKDWK